MKLTVVRHGETVENAGDIIMGQHDGSLSENGLAQAEEAARKLEAERFDQAWTSDLKRCVDTAKFIVRLHSGLDLQKSKALREVDYGIFQGRPGAEIREYFDKNGGFNPDIKPPGGESHTEMNRRVLSFINRLLTQHPDDSILVVSHNGPIEAIRAAIERTPFTKDSKNAGIKEFDIHTPLDAYDG